MKRTRLGLTAIGAGLALVLSGCASGGGGGGATDGSTNPEDLDSGVTATSIDVGVVADITGPSVSSQVPYLNGLYAVVQQINDAGGVHGRTINLLVEDEKTDPTTGVAGFKKLVTQTPVLTILGLASSGTQAAVAPLLDESQVVVIGGTATVKSAVSPRQDYFFALAPTYADQVDQMVAYAQQLAGTDQPRIAVVHYGVASGVEVAELVEARCDEGLCVDTGVTILEGTATTADAPYQTVASQDPDVVLFHGSPATANLFLRSKEKFGGDFDTIAIQTAGGIPAYAGVSQETADRFTFLGWNLPAPFASEGLDDYIAAAKAAGFENDITKTEFLTGYIQGLVLQAALEKTGADLTRVTFADTFNSGLTVPTRGLSVDVTYSATDHLGIQDEGIFGYDVAADELTLVVPFGEFSSSLTNEYAK